MNFKKMNGEEDYRSIISKSDYTDCSASEIIKVFDEDVRQVFSPGADVLYCAFSGDEKELLEKVKQFPAAEKMLVYTLQDPELFNVEELDRMTTLFDTLTRGKTAYGLKMKAGEASYHIFLRVKENAK